MTMSNLNAKKLLAKKSSTSRFMRDTRRAWKIIKDISNADPPAIPLA
jgi:hypothetical protein